MTSMVSDRLTNSFTDRHCFVTPAAPSVFEACLVRGSVALGMMLLAAYAVATLEWWGVVPALSALVLEGRHPRPSI